MERAGTGLMDVTQLMGNSGGASAFYHSPVESRFTAVVAQAQASAGSRNVARSDVPTGMYVLNVLPFTDVPEKVSIIRLTVPLHQRPSTVDLAECGTFVRRAGGLDWCRCSILSLIRSPALLSCGGKSRHVQIQSAFCRGYYETTWS